MKILMTGPQGCGKGTIGKMLAEKLDLPIVSVGELLRNLPQDHVWKKDIEIILQSGKLAPIYETAQILKAELVKEAYQNGYILDGWSRQLVDLDYYNPGFDKVVFLNISDEVSIQRLSNRLTCSKCGQVYNLVTMPPRMSGICDKCDGSLYQRTDDTLDAIKKRLEIFHQTTAKAIDKFRQKGVLLEVDASGNPPEVFDLVMTALKIK